MPSAAGRQVVGDGWLPDGGGDGVGVSAAPSREAEAASERGSGCCHTCAARLSGSHLVGTVWKPAGEVERALVETMEIPDGARHQCIS